MKKFALSIVFVSSFFSMSWSQNLYDTDQSRGDTANYPYWVEMMQDPNANVFETVKAFEKYWENRPDRKGNGYNPFKRWEWYIRHKINPDGSRQAPDHDLKAWEAYRESHRPVNEFSGDWENIGPVTVPSTSNQYWGNGRINGIAFHPSDPGIIYAGAPAGGLWKTTDGGQDWEPLTDGLPTLGVSAMIVDYNDPDIIYIGTGDRDNGDAAGMGVFKSTDGGETWAQSNTGMNNVTVKRMVQHPASNNIIFAMTNNGLFRTTDAGVNWTRMISGNCEDILFKPDDLSVMYAVKGDKFWRSTDSGETWLQINSGLPLVSDRSVIGVSPDQPDYVYFLATINNVFYGLYRSIDGGSTFELRSNSPNIMGRECNGGLGGQANYDLDIAVDPLDADIVYAGGINCWKSVDGGLTWAMISNQLGDCGAYPVHADLHVLEYNPLDGKLYAGNDGGVWWTDNGGTTWNRIVNGLAIGQQYKLGQSRLISNHISAGFQDNGISTFHTGEWIQSEMWADGIETALDIADTTLGYGCAQGGYMFRRQNDSATKMIAGWNIGGITEYGAWVTPFCQHETDPDVMFIGYQNLWRTNNLLDEDPVWTKISDETGTVLVVEQSPADVDIFYLATDDGLFRSDNIMDETPAFMDLTGQLPGSGAVTDIEAHPSNPDVLYISQTARVYKSEDKGLSWEDISGTLPDVNLNGLAYYDRNGIEGLYVASNIGVFFKDEFMDDWADFSAGLPAAILATEVEIFHHPVDPAMDRISISTYGRGLWRTIPYHYQPVADLTSSDTLVATGYPVDFYDRSAGYPQSWSWVFEGGTPSSSSAANPTGIIYDEEGVFEVSLTVTNSEGTDTKTISGYITVDNVLNIDDHPLDNIRLYPNPVKNLATFSSSAITSFQVYDLMGTLITRRDGNKVDMSGLSPGIYFVIGFDKHRYPLYKRKIVKN